MNKYNESIHSLNNIDPQHLLSEKITLTNPTRIIKY